jgi:aspartyl protease family protein
MFDSLQRACKRNRLAPSLGLAILLTAGAGLPGFVPLSNYGQQPTQEEPSFRLMAMTEIPPGPNGHYIARADINNERVDVLVDTGASVVALSWEDAEFVGLKPRNLSFKVPVATANGVAKAAMVMLEEVEIDGVRVYDVKGLVLQKGAMRGTLLGMSFLGRLQSWKVENGRLLLKN